MHYTSFKTECNLYYYKVRWWLIVARKNTEPIELKFSSRLEPKRINRVLLPFQDGGRLHNVITTKT